jgi:putative transposase
MPNYRRALEPGGTYFFTLVTDRRQRLFEDTTARQLLHNAIRLIQTEQPFDLKAIVLLPDHVHCIWRLPEEDADFSIRWACIKRHFTKARITSGGQELPISRARREHREREVWQKRFWEHRIRNEEDLIRHVNYIHYNPIKHGLVRCPHAWPYSSFHRWVRDGYYREGWLCDCRGDRIDPPDFASMAVAGE